MKNKITGNKAKETVTREWWWVRVVFVSTLYKPDSEPPQSTVILCLLYYYYTTRHDALRALMWLAWLFWTSGRLLANLEDGELCFDYFSSFFCVNLDLLFDPSPLSLSRQEQFYLLLGLLQVMPSWSDQIHYCSVLTNVHVTHKRIIIKDDTRDGQPTFIRVRSRKAKHDRSHTKETRFHTSSKEQGGHSNEIGITGRNNIAWHETWNERNEAKSENWHKRERKWHGETGRKHNIKMKKSSTGSPKVRAVPDRRPKNRRIVISREPNRMLYSFIKLPSKGSKSRRKIEIPKSEATIVEDVHSLWSHASHISVINVSCRVVTRVVSCRIVSCPYIPIPNQNAGRDSQIPDVSFLISFWEAWVFEHSPNCEVMCSPWLHHWKKTSEGLSLYSTKNSSFNDGFPWNKSKSPKVDPVAKSGKLDISDSLKPGNWSLSKLDEASWLMKKSISDSVDEPVRPGTVSGEDKLLAVEFIAASESRPSAASEIGGRSESSSGICSKACLDGDLVRLPSSVDGVYGRWLPAGEGLLPVLYPGDAGGVKVKTSDGRQ